MKCLSLWQPWASLVAIGAKRVETRSWATGYRGPLAIHAAKRWSLEQYNIAASDAFGETLHANGFGRFWRSSPGVLPTGAIVAVCDLTKVLRPIDCLTEIPHFIQEQDFGDYRPGRYAWFLANIRPLKAPIPFKARQRLFSLPDKIAAAVRRAAR